MHGLVFSPGEVAGVLRVSEETVRREIRQSKLTALKVGDQYRLTASDLGAWLGWDRFLELFAPLSSLFEVLSKGGLEEAEADALALEAVRAVRSGLHTLPQSSRRPGKSKPVPQS